MRNDLLSLIQLSDIDKKIYELKKSNKDLPIKIDELEGEIKQAENKLNAINTEIQELDKKISDTKTFAREEQEKLEFSNERLESISTNKEYDAVHTEIATHKKNIEEAKANAVHYQQVLENLREDQKAVEKKCKEVLEANTPDLEKLKAELNSLEGKIEEQVKKGQNPRGKISKRIISVYDRLVKRRKSPYVISVVNWDNKVCGICNRAQPPQKLNEVSKMEIMGVCESCGSILVWQEDEKSEKTPA